LYYDESVQEKIQHTSHLFPFPLGMSNKITVQV